jgi:adenosine deaminase
MGKAGMPIDRWAAVAGILLLVAASCGGANAGSAADAFVVATKAPPLLRAFLYRMPKGGDLHNHLSGAAYAEANIRAGADAGGCVDPATAKMVFVTPCAPPNRPLADAKTDAALNRLLVNAWSMRDFLPSSGNSGHDHFFATFALFGGAAPMGDMAAEVVNRAGRQRMRYIELMATFQSRELGKLAEAVTKQQPWTWDGDLNAYEAALMQAGLGDLAKHASAEIDGVEQRLRTVLQCGTPRAEPGCGMTVRWLQQVNRAASPAVVFAQTLFGGLLQAGDKRAVGLDYVAPEDNPNALAHYTAQMHMLDYLHRRMPASNVSLHAGELTMGLVRPEELLFHIREAVEIGHAKRIGHGVDVMYEERPFALLKDMAQRRVAVEVNLTSNAQILGVKGADHPFPIYRSHGVPVVLSTDDEGIERIDRTHELQRAVTTYGLSWTALLGLERNTLEYAFVEGASLWADPVAWRRNPACSGVDATAKPTAACAAFLEKSEKARLQWAFEADLIRFDREIAAERR